VEAKGQETALQLLQGGCESHTHTQASCCCPAPAATSIDLHHVVTISQLETLACNRGAWPILSGVMGFPGLTYLVLFADTMPAAYDKITSLEAALQESAAAATAKDQELQTTLADVVGGCADMWA
jgi:hypothetical protein